jgi:flagellar motor switch/type III secretory pathway protein FliN
MSLQDLSNSIAEAVAESWSMLLSKTAALAPQDLVSLEDSDASPEGTHLCCDLKFSGHIEGQVRYFVPKTEALTMVGMMLSMGADDALIDSTREGDLGDEEIDALKEGFSQLSATAATILREKLDCTVSAELESIEVKELSGSLDGFGAGDQTNTMMLSLEGYDDGPFYQIFSSSFSDSIENLTSGDANEAAQETRAPLAPSHASDLSSLAGLNVSADLILAERLMDFKSLLTLAVGSVIEFWKPCDHPADLCIQNTPIANGEIVLCQNQHFGIRVLNLAPKRKVYQKGDH